MSGMSTSIKSITFPYIILSMMLPIAPPNIIAEDIMYKLEECCVLRYIMIRIINAVEDIMKKSVGL